MEFDVGERRDPVGVAQLAVVDVSPADSYVLNRLRCSLILDRIPADAMLDNVALKDLLGRKW